MYAKFCQNIQNSKYNTNKTKKKEYCLCFGSYISVVIHLNESFT